MRRYRVLLALVTIAGIFMSASPGQASTKSGEKQERPTYEIDWDQVAQEVETVEAETGQKAISGEIAGAAYIAQIPEDWNGDLVIYAHGYRGEGTDLTVDAPPAYQFLTASGYAWAASSYRRNSYDPGIGVQDTKKLTRRMQRTLRRHGDLDKTFLTGFSMGGHVTASAIERYPYLYDGAMPVCGVLGDVELFDYFLDYNVGSAAFAGVAPDYDFPDEAWTTSQVPTIKQGLSTDPTGEWAGGAAQLGGAPSPLTQAGQDFKDFVEIGSGGERVTYDAAWNYWHGLADPSGNFFFALGEGDGTIANRRGIVSQNSDMTYLDEYGFDIDKDVVRITASKRIRRGWGNQPAPIIKGRPSIPVLTVHTTGDLFVPIEMAQIYGQEVINNGRGDLLVQRAVRDVGHCSFTAEELIQSYTDLFAWVETGVKPAGEDLIGDISSPTLGCAFTVGAGGSGVRAFLEPCPEDKP